MSEIIDNEEVDKDTVAPEALEQQFIKKYMLKCEVAVTLKNSYINKLAGTRSLKLAASQSDGSIEVYAVNGAALSRICRLSGHQKELSEVVFSPKEDYMLYSAGVDGLVKLWDTRASGSCVMEYKDDEEELLRPYECMDVSSSGRVLCAGSQLTLDDAYLVFWDARQPKPLGGYWNSHTDDITQVKFHKDKEELLASGSLDGLLNLYNITEEREDDALVYSLNVENSVEKLSWLGDRIACLTQSHDMQLWDAQAGDMFKNYSRDKISRSIKRSKDDDCYLVDAYTSRDNTPCLLAGSYGGNGDVLRSVTITDKKLKPCTNFIENKQVVRCCHYDKDSDILVTAGESGLITAWAAGAEPAAAPAKLPSSKQHAHRRHKPY